MDNLQFTDEMLKLDSTLYGNMEKISDTLSKCRVRIFYKGMNRNRTFISEDFANQLIASLPYAPVKGIFDSGSMDYEDHGEDNTDGRIYGVVASEPNFAWEKHFDVDGIEREYACADVILFTGLYPEANLVGGKGQSMEIYRNTVEYNWAISEDDGIPYVMFTKGTLVGLQILGDRHEPCFEGAAFFSLYKSVADLMNTIDKYSKKKEEKNEMELENKREDCCTINGAPTEQVLSEAQKFTQNQLAKEISEANNAVTVDKTMFRLSDSEKADIIFSAMNPKYENEGIVDYVVLEVYDDYFISYSRNSKLYTRTYYTKNNDAIEIGESQIVYIVDVTAPEYEALEKLKSVGGTYEKTNEIVSELENAKTTYEAEKSSLVTEKDELAASLETIKAEFEQFKTESNEKITDFEKKVSEISAENVRLTNENSDINNEKAVLTEFKNKIETEQKEAILEEFCVNLEEAQIAAFREKMDSYTVEDFKKELCVTAYDNNNTIFTKKDSENLIFKGGDPEYNNFETGIERILNKYKNGGNK